MLEGPHESTQHGMTPRHQAVERSSSHRQLRGRRNQFSTSDVNTAARRASHSVATWTVIESGRPVSWASRSRWSSQPRPLRGMDPNQIPHLFRVVMGKMMQAGLTINPRKMQLASPRISLLGFVVDGGGGGPPCWMGGSLQMVVAATPPPG
ncbi:uncharacterized protein LOC135394314 [Ornithodoros turicata]|uniref:uncharacterized protein LOC135394314 n=1 Tax=Ornithodoros turicata TaxID=34597 RepID=UPI00313A3660